MDQRMKWLNAFYSIVIISRVLHLLSGIFFAFTMIILINSYTTFFTPPYVFSPPMLLLSLALFILLHISFQRYIRKVFIEPIFNSLCKQVIYKRRKVLSRKLIMGSDILPFEWRCKLRGNDFIQGYYNSIKFCRSDIRVYKIISPNRPRIIDDYFNGRWLCFELKQCPLYNFKIVQKGFIQPLYDKTFDYTFLAKGLYEDRNVLRSIELSDKVFHQTFELYGNDAQEVLKVLTPSIRAFLCKLVEVIDGRMALSFQMNRLHVAIHNNTDTLKINLGIKDGAAELKNEIAYELKLITILVDGMPTVFNN